MSPATQQWVALAIVAAVACAVVARLGRRWVAPPLARWLLQRGRVKLAMRVRKWGGGPGCDC